MYSSYATPSLSKESFVYFVCPTDIPQLPSPFACKCYHSERFMNVSRIPRSLLLAKIFTIHF